MICDFVALYSQREVSVANYVMHINHCVKYMQCCPMCKEPVNRNNMQEHIDENHKLVHCKQCHQEMENSQLEEHMVRPKLLIWGPILNLRYCINFMLISLITWLAHSHQVRFWFLMITLYSMLLQESSSLWPFNFRP